MISFLLSLINPLSKVLGTINRSIDNETEREKARLAAIVEFSKAQADMLNGPGKWLLALFIVPLGFWFSAVCIYSVFWCAGCAFPMDWTIAALPKPLDEWSGWIVMSLFGYGTALGTARILRR
jgi:hypothetical protein